MRTTIKSLIVFSASLGLAFSCGKTEDIVTVSPETKGTVTVDLSFAFGESRANTKATSVTAMTDAEKVITDIQYFIFDYDNSGNNTTREVYLTTDDFNISTSGGVTTASLKNPVTITTGRKAIAAVVNGPDFRYYYTFSGVRSNSWYFLETYNNRDSDFVMYAEQNPITITTSTTTLPTLTVQKRVARFVISGITNSLYSGKDITEFIPFLANVQGHFGFYTDYVDGSYVHPTGRSLGNASPSTDQSTITGRYIGNGRFDTGWPYLAGAASYNPQTLGNIPIANGETYSTPFYLYSCPQASTSAWQPWLCLYVVTAGAPYWYNIPLSLPIERNKTYTYSITLHTPGADRPCISNDPGAYTVSMSVDDWSTGDVTEMTY